MLYGNGKHQSQELLHLGGEEGDAIREGHILLLIFCFTFESKLLK